MFKRLTKNWKAYPWFGHVVIYALLLLLLIFPNSGLKNGIIWASLLGVIIHRLRAGPALHMGGLGVVIGVYGLIALLACVFSTDPWFSVRQWMKLFELICGYFVVVNLLRTKSQVETNVHRYFWAAGTLALIDLGRLGWATWQTGTALVHGRWFDSLLGYPTIASGIYAASLLLGLPFLIHAVRLRTPWSAAAVLLMMTGMVVLLYFLQTRSILLGLFSGVLVIWILVPLPRRYQAALLAGGILVLAAFVSIPGVFQERLLDADTSDRAAIWEDVNYIFEQATDEPHRKWIGFGYGHKMFETLHADLPRPDRQAERVYNHAHNMFQETRIQTGYLGLGAWIALLVMAIYRLATQFPSVDKTGERMVTACLAGAGISFVIYGLFSLFFAMAPAFFFWSLLATCMAYAKAP